jgi:hypothetical protein
VKLKHKKEMPSVRAFFLLGRQRALHQIIARDLDTVLIKAAMVDSAGQPAQFQNPLEANANLSQLGHHTVYY